MPLVSGFMTAVILAAAPQGPWIVTCLVTPADPAAQPQRTFRVGPGSVQEWRPADKEFGPNLCLSYSCVADRGRLRAVISSATVSLTLSFDQSTGRAAWSTAGASNLRSSSGPCTVRQDDGSPPSA